jgi:hypothetical protein
MAEPTISRSATAQKSPVTREVPAEFRLFLLRHADLLKAVDEWTIRLLVPRRLRKATALYR